jgi:hypothetical protein
LYIGHNLTQSTNVPEAHGWTAGNYAAGYALTENLFIATSPWIWVSYNTYNIHLKWSQPLSPSSTIGFFASYFDSYNSTNLANNSNSRSINTPGAPFSAASTPTGHTVSSSLNRYQWTSYSLHALYSYEYDNNLSQYFNLKYSYFINDDMPYSLRMDPGDDNISDQWDASTLLKVPLGRSHLSWAFELGAIGLNYLSTFAHFGTSISYLNQDWLVQVGASYTAPFSELGKDSALEIGRYDNREHYSKSANEYYTERYLQVAVHPEVQVQYSF